MFTSSELQAMSDKLLPQVEAAHMYMSQAHVWLQSDITIPEVAKLLGDMDVNMIMHTHGLAKKVKTRVQYTSLLDIARKFALDAKNAGAVMAKCPFEPAVPTAEKSATAATSSIVELGPGGRLDVASLRSYGFKLGATVEKKAKATGTPNTIYHIAAIDDTVVSLIDTESNALDLTPAALIDLYKLAKVSEDVLLQWDAMVDPTLHHDAEAEFAIFFLILPH